MKITIKKNLDAARGNEVAEWFGKNVGILPVKVIVGRDARNMICAYIDEVKDENKIGIVVDPRPFPSNLLDDNGIMLASCEIKLAAFADDKFEGELSQATVSATKVEAKIGDVSAFAEDIEKAAKAAGLPVEAVEENVRVMIANDFSAKLVTLVLSGYRKYAVPAHKTKVAYMKASPTDDHLKKVAQKVINRQPVILQGGQSVGKNVCAETIAQIFAMPYFLFTPNEDTTTEEIFGGKTTDNSASNALTSGLAEAYLRFMKGESEFAEDAASYEFYKAQSASVHIITEYSEIATAFMIGGIAVINEMNMGSANALNWMNQVGDNTGFIQLPGRGRVEINRDFVLMGTQNPGYEGCSPQNQATLSRFGIIDFGWPKAITKILMNTKEVKAALASGADTKTVEADAKVINDLYCDFMKQVDNKLISDQILNIRGFARALENSAMFGEDLKSNVLIEVVNGLQTKDSIKAKETINKYL